MSSHRPVSHISTTQQVRCFSKFTALQNIPSPLASGKSENLTHLTATGAAHMVHIPPPYRAGTTKEDEKLESTQLPTKPSTARFAVARCVLVFSNATPLRLIRSASLKKGDALSVARIAGIMGAKQTAQLIPLCHNIPLSGVSVDVDLVGPGSISPPLNPVNKSVADDVQWRTKYEDVGEFGGMVITAQVHTFGQTGVEMEALTAATIAGLTAYDMCKAVDKRMRMNNARVCMKEGGKSGQWMEESK